jgi:hypothetical protein
VWLAEALSLLASEENKTNVLFFSFSCAMLFRDEKLFKKHMHMKGLEKHKINFYLLRALLAKIKEKPPNLAKINVRTFAKMEKY